MMIKEIKNFDDLHKLVICKLKPTSHLALKMAFSFCDIGHDMMITTWSLTTIGLLTGLVKSSKYLLCQLIMTIYLFMIILLAGVLFLFICDCFGVDT